MLDYATYAYLYDGEIADTGYGFVSNKGVEVSSDSELRELNED